MDFSANSAVFPSFLKRLSRNVPIEQYCITIWSPRNRDHDVHIHKYKYKHEFIYLSNIVGNAADNRCGAKSSIPHEYNT